MTTTLDEAVEVADSVLYEGYLLYPYRHSSAKNRMRWQFGVLAPRAWIEAQGPVVDGVAGSTESWWQQTECLVEADEEAAVLVRPRFLQLRSRSVEALEPDGSLRPVDRLDLGERSEVGFDEGVPHTSELVLPLGRLQEGEQRFEIELPGGTDSEDCCDASGRVRGRVTRRTRPLSAAVRLSAEKVRSPFPLVRLRVRMENTDETTPADCARELALRRALLATHCLIGIDEGSFLSLCDPPQWAVPAAQECVNVRTFPVLAGPPGTTDAVLSAPIILYDHVQVAPESPGDLHDSTEIDEILSLRTLTLTDQEKLEARATDPRAAAIVDRVDGMPPEMMEKLHGAVRSLRPVRGPAEPPAPDPGVPWWEPGADASVSPMTDAVLVDGVPVSRGSRVLLRPRTRGTDAHDMFLAGRTARVEGVFLDVEGSQHVAVVLEDDPTAELHQWYGRFHYFSPGEVEPIAEEAHEQPGGRAT